MRRVAQKRIFLSPPFVGTAERAAIAAAFDSKYVAPCGPMVDAFERRLAALAGRKHAVAVASGTAALDLAMAEYGVDRRWTVIAPTLTFIATVGPAYHRGAKLVFVDSDATGNIDVKLLARALADAKGRTLVVGVDLYGRCCDYDAIGALCDRHGAVFVCDAAEAVGATYKGRPSGSAGAVAVYSFNGNKIVTTSGGGALLTDDDGIAARARKRSQQAREPAVWYEHKEVGYNYRLSNLLAAVGLAQLGRLAKILSKRRRIWEAYGADGRLAPVAGENHWLTVKLLASEAERDAALARLVAANIEARPVWKPLHLQPVFRRCRVYGGAVAADLFARGICLPSGTGMTTADVARVKRVLAGIVGGGSPLARASRAS